MILPIDSFRHVIVLPFCRQSNAQQNDSRNKAIRPNDTQHNTAVHNDNWHNKT
jgi:hypothetical protein